MGGWATESELYVKFTRACTEAGQLQCSQWSMNDQVLILQAMSSSGSRTF